MDDVAEQITLKRAKGSNTWEILHTRFLEETEVEFKIVEGAVSLGIVASDTSTEGLIGRAIRQLEMIVQAGS